jgi:hypothetical protein
MLIAKIKLLRHLPICGAPKCFIPALVHHKLHPLLFMSISVNKAGRSHALLQIVSDFGSPFI